MIKGTLFYSDFTTNDILECLSSYKILTDREPSSVIVRGGNEGAIKWLIDFGINPIVNNAIQKGEILII